MVANTIHSNQTTNAMETIFKKGDRVFLHVYGWGKIIDVDFDLKVKFESLDCNKYFDHETSKLLSFNEYKLVGFSQERPEELPNKGDIVWGRNEFPSEWHIGHFFEKRGDNYLISSHPQPTGWHNIVSEITTKNPYSDEKN